VEIAMVRDQLEPAARPELIERLRSASALVKQSVRAIRDVMAQLRPPGLDELGLPAALRWHADIFQSRTAVAVMLSVDEALPRPSGAVEDALVQVYVEALTNIATHSGARAVQPRLEPRGDTIALQVVDDGRGFNPDNPPPRGDNSGWGLKIMRERALAVGGQLRVSSRTGTGTRVELLISRCKWE
jgi:signal transduction histidine kinase